jgi:hypothetical protein
MSTGWLPPTGTTGVRGGAWTVRSTVCCQLGSFCLPGSESVMKVSCPLAMVSTANASGDAGAAARLVVSTTCVPSGE